MKPYQVEITTIAIVMAEDEAHALQVTESEAHAIFSDDPNPRIEIDGEVTDLAKMSHGWDGECIPYGGDGNTRLKDLLQPNG